MKGLLNAYDLKILPPQERWTGRPGDYEARLSAIQKFRAVVYLKDGAIPAAALDAEGRHRSPVDEFNYHIEVRQPEGPLAGVLRLRVYPADIEPERLHLASALERMPPDKRTVTREAMTAFIGQARQEQVRFGEVGGWAVAEEARNQLMAIQIPLTAYAAYELLGSALVVAHATHRHKSAVILKRLGAWSLTHPSYPLAPHFDPGYGCEMEFLCFSSKRVAPAYAETAAQLREFITARGLLTA